MRSRAKRFAITYKGASIHIAARKSLLTCAAWQRTGEFNRAVSFLSKGCAALLLMDLLCRRAGWPLETQHTVYKS